MRNLLAAVVSIVLLLSCSEPPDAPTPAPEPLTEVLPEPDVTESASALAADYAAQGWGRFRSLEKAMVEMQESLDDFSKNPTVRSLTQLQMAWGTAYAAWGRAYLWLVHRALEDPARFSTLSRIDSIPIMPGFVDGLAQWPDSGIVNDPTVSLDGQSLLAQHDVTAQGEASVGFQVVEFLLSGEPLQPRTLADFVDPVRDIGAPGLPVAELPQHRRRQYLTVAVEILVADIRAVLDDLPGRSFDMQQAINAAVKTLERIALVESLAESDDPVQTYLAPEAQALALVAVRESLSYWQMTDPDALATDHPALAQMASLLSGYLQRDQDTVSVLASIRTLQ